MTDSAAIVAGYLRKAERALDEALLLLKDSRTEGACSRAYYAMHDAAHAALFATGNEAPEAIIKTHHQLIGEFGRNFVQGGYIDAAHGRAIRKVQEVRLLADYDSASPSLPDAETAVKLAEAFVAAVRSRFSI